MACKQARAGTRSDSSSADQDLRLLREVIAVSNQAEDFEDALCLVLPRLAQRCRCNIGQAFILAADDKQRLDLCRSSYEAAPGLLAILQTPASLALDSAGYLRRIIAHPAPQHTAALTADSARGRSALAVGLVAGLAIPVVAGAEILAILEFLADHAIEADRDALSTLAGAGVALGRVLDRQRCRTVMHGLQRLVSLGTFAAGIAHELNNPLSSILVSARVARKHDYDKDHLNEILGEIIADAERCAQIVKSLVRFARQEPGERSPVNLSELIRRVVGITRRVAEEQQVRFDLDISEPLPAVLAEPTAIEQALVSVVHSALHASGNAGGTVRIKAGESNGNVRIRLFVGNVEGTLTERGHDLSSGAACQPGLAFEMARGIIVQHGGTIDVDRQPGGGSTITIDLPLGVQSLGQASEQ